MAHFSWYVGDRKITESSNVERTYCWPTCLDKRPLSYSAFEGSDCRTQWALMSERYRINISTEYLEEGVYKHNESQKRSEEIGCLSDRTDMVRKLIPVSYFTGSNELGDLVSAVNVVFRPPLLAYTHPQTLETSDVDLSHPQPSEKEKLSDYLPV
ncbi:hypothetical protein J6590_049504 [Homalodisca vitripennis]|nr:hypothetical protein J6590_049504 [Homalodisca vitripennis]